MRMLDFTITAHLDGTDWPPSLLATCNRPYCEWQVVDHQGEVRSRLGDVRLEHRTLTEALVTHAQDHGCPECGQPVEQPGTGRRRRFCSDRCRKAAHRHSVTGGAA